MVYITDYPQDCCLSFDSIYLEKKKVREIIKLLIVNYTEKHLSTIKNQDERDCLQSENVNGDVVVHT